MGAIGKSLSVYILLRRIIVNKSKRYKRKTQIFFCFLLICFSLLLSVDEIVKASHPCNCKEDRIIKLEDPLLEGEDVEGLQKRLKELKYYQGNIDGQFGPLTDKAVKEFQQTFHLEVTGIVDKDTWNMLGHLSDSKITSRKGKQPKGELSITINLYNRTLILYSDGDPYKKYPVTIGKKETPSPVGEWYIKNKYKRIDDGPLGSRWMGLNVPWGVYGIHGTNKPWEIGVDASHGCIRLHNEYVEEIFEWIELNTRVKIIGPKQEVIIKNTLKLDNIGYDVMELQEQLRKGNFYHAYLDGTYTPETSEAVKELESQFNLKVDGIADRNIYELLRINYEF